jgi:exosortase/archaeosortase family protein
MWTDKLNNWRKDNANLFVINILLVYALWKAFAYYVKNSTGAIHVAWIKFIVFLGSVYAWATSLVLNAFGEDTVHNGIAIFYPVLYRKITVEDHCLAIPATVIFTGTILLFTGSRKNKLWFIPMGILLIAMINVIRLVFLSYIFAHFSKEFFDINHSLIYVVLTYSLIFLMIVWWMRKFAAPGNGTKL